jgi:hypothetical protein
MKEPISYLMKPPRIEHFSGVALVEPEPAASDMLPPLPVPWWYRWIRDWRIRMWIETTVWPPQ